MCDVNPNHGLISYDPMNLASVLAKVSWNVNIVRIPISEDCWLGTNPALPAATSGSAYRAQVIAYVNLLNAHGIIAEIGDIQYDDQPPRANRHLTDMPTAAQTPIFWQSVAAIFAGNDAVVFGLWNEPIPGTVDDTTAAWTCLRDGGTCVGISYQVAGTQQLVNVIRSTGATNMILITGIRGATTMTRWVEFKPNDSYSNLAAAWHSYNTISCNSASCWDAEIAPLAAAAPFVVEEFGEFDLTDGYVDQLMPWLDAHGIGYLAWDWSRCENNPCGYATALITDYLTGAPTNYGVGIKAHFLSRR